MFDSDLERDEGSVVRRRTFLWFQYPRLQARSCGPCGDQALCKRRLHQERSAQAADPPDEGSVHRLASTSSRCLMWMRWHTLDFDAQSLRRTWGDFSVRVRSICALFVGLVLLSLA